MSTDKNALAKMIRKELEEGSKSQKSHHSQVQTTGWFENISYTTSRQFSPSELLLEEQRVLSSQTAGTVKDAYGFLRTKVLFSLSKIGGSVLGITSPKKGDGKTLTAINLAISLSKKIDRTVLLVDADLGSPMIHQYFGLDEQEGLIDYLTKGVSIEKLLVNPAIDRLLLLPGRVDEVGDLDLLSSPRMHYLVKELKNRYESRLIIFDLPPILDAPHTMEFSPFLDGILLVTKAGVTQQKDAERALDLVKDTPVIGTVLNQGQ